MRLTATCPACGTEVDVVPVVQRAELVRQQNLLLVNFEAHEVEHHCIDPREDRPMPACGVRDCDIMHHHLHRLDGQAWVT